MGVEVYRLTDSAQLQAIINIAAADGGFASKIRPAAEAATTLACQLQRLLGSEVNCHRLA